MHTNHQPPTTPSRPPARPESIHSLDVLLTAHPDALHFFSVLYAGLRGWCELSWIAGDPAHKDGHSYHKEWHEVTSEYTALAARCAALAAQHGNVYVSRTLYTERRRGVDCALPSPVIFVDDMPASPALAPSMLVQTSAGSWHGYYIASEPLPNADGNELARRGAAALGCDRSGADVTQIVRVPGTFNTKRGGRFSVQLVTSSGPRYHADALGAAWPELATPDVSTVMLDNSRVAWWLGNTSALLDHEGIPRRVRNPNARALFAKRGQWRDTSTYRYTIARSLVMHGFPDDEAAALLIHFCEPANGRKGGAWLVADTQRCLAKTRGEIAPYHGIRATTLAKKYQAQFPQSLPAQPPARVGRPSRATADTLLAFYHQHADSTTHCLMSRAAVCSALNIGGSTLARLEKELTQRGAIHRQTAPNRRSSWIVFGPKPDDLGLTKITENRPDNAPTTHNFDNTPMPLESQKADEAITKEHTAPIALAFAPLARPSGGVCSFNSNPAPNPSSALPTASPPPPPAPNGAQRRAVVFGPNAPALAILMQDPTYSEFLREEAARPPAEPRHQLVSNTQRVAYLTPTLPPARPRHHHHRRNLSRVPLSMVRAGETLQQAYDRLFGGM